MKFNLKDNGVIDINNPIVRKIYDDYYPGISDGLKNKDNQYDNKVIEISWSKVSEAKSYKFTYISSHNITKTINTTLTKVYLTDLLCNEAYTYFVEAFDSNKEMCFKCKNRSFKTLEGVSWLNIQGVENARDIASYPLLDNTKRIKPMMLVRTASLDSVSEEGIKACNATTDLDLRFQGETKDRTTSPLRCKNYINVPGLYYLGVPGFDDPSNKGILKKELDVFLNKENYPIYAHCSLGRDRTGCLLYIIESLLGMDRNFKQMDYEMTMISRPGNLDNNTALHMVTNGLGSLIRFIDTFKGNDDKEKTESFLEEYIGYTSKEFDLIRSILLENC